MKTAIVTGGSGGIGRAAAQALAKAGCNVYELSRHAVDTPRIKHLEADVTEEDTVRSAVRAMLKKHDIGRITLKKRGVEIIPEKEIKRLDPRGSREAILFYTRIRGEKAAILALPLHTNSKAEK